MPAPPPSRRGLSAWALVAGLLVPALAAGGWWLMSAGGGETYDGPTRAVERGPLVISVSEGGTIEAREKVILKCEVDERSTTITYLVPEGTHVQEGDLVIELDASVLTDELYDEEIDVLDTEAEFLASKEDLEVVKNQARADLLQAELALRFAGEDVTKYVEGEYPRELMAATNEVTLAEERLQQARDKLEWSQKLHDEGFLSGSELDADRLSFQSAELEVKLARAEVDLLQTYTHQRQLAQLESDVEQAEMALERIRRKTAADIAQAETNLRVHERQLERQRIQLADIQRQVANCRIEAPVSGMVVYATTGRGSFRGNEEPLAVGREVRRQEELVHIPVADAKSARIKIHESALDKVRLGQEVVLTVDAIPGRTFRGEVARISPLPDAQMQWLNPDLKVYDTEIHVKGDLADLRTGMTCRAEILIEEYDEVLFVPLHTVVRVGDQPTVYVVEGADVEPRPVEVGLDNNRMVHVLSGLEEGELVSLAPPLQEGETRPRIPLEEDLLMPPELQGPPPAGGPSPQEAASSTARSRPVEGS